MYLIKEKKNFLEKRFRVINTNHTFFINKTRLKQGIKQGKSKPSQVLNSKSGKKFLLPIDSNNFCIYIQNLTKIISTNYFVYPHI